jgi:glucose-1-phosphate thymidylyltransferase
MFDSSNSDKKIRRAIILCGGQGKEMEPLSDGLPKPLISLLGQPNVVRVMANLKFAGVEEVIIVIKDGGEKIVQVASDSAKELGLSAEFIDQGSNKEVLGAIGVAEDAVSTSKNDASFLLAYGDIVSSQDFYRSLIESAADGTGGAVSLVLQKDVKTYGTVELRDDATVHHIVEKPAELDPNIGGYVLAGAFVLPSSFFEFASASEDFIEALNRFAETRPLRTSIWNGAWTDLGYPWDVLNGAFRLLDELKSTKISTGAKVSPTAILEPPVIIEEGAQVDHHAVLKGPVYIGRNTYIGTGALVHNYSSLEEGVTVGAYSEITSSVLQPYSSIGRGCFVGNTVTGLGAIFEPHVTTLNVLHRGTELARLEPVVKNGKRLIKIGAIIGNNSRIGANSVLYPSAVVKSEESVAPNSVLKAQ